MTTLKEGDYNIIAPTKLATSIGDKVLIRLPHFVIIGQIVRFGHERVGKHKTRYKYLTINTPSGQRHQISERLLKLVQRLPREDV